jgi:hypothetical protein
MNRLIFNTLFLLKNIQKILPLDTFWKIVYEFTKMVFSLLYKALYLNSTRFLLPTLPRSEQIA